MLFILINRQVLVPLDRLAIFACSPFFFSDFKCLEAGHISEKSKIDILDAREDNLLIGGSADSHGGTILQQPAVGFQQEVGLQIIQNHVQRTLLAFEGFLGNNDYNFVHFGSDKKLLIKVSTKYCLIDRTTNWTFLFMVANQIEG